jgi:hypothetical protein
VRLKGLEAEKNFDSTKIIRITYDFSLILRMRLIMI